MLQQQPTCEACGSSEKLQVHHRRPFHLHPELELDRQNLIVLCMSPGRECHIRIGHGDSFRAYNPNVGPDAAEALALVNAGKPLGPIWARARTLRLTE